MNKNNAFLVGLKYSFQTDTKLYLLLDYVPGGELFNHLQIEQFFSEDRSLFYAAQLVLALEFFIPDFPSKYTIFYILLKFYT